MSGKNQAKCWGYASVRELAIECDINYNALCHRLSRNEPLELALAYLLGTKIKHKIIQRKAAKQKRQLLDLTGQTFGKLTVLSYYGHKDGQRCWNTQCACGNTKVVSTKLLRNGSVKSCGCLVSDMLRKRNYKHGCAQTSLYRIFHHMKARCYNSTCRDYRWYGARGIIICDEWLNDYTKFHQWALSHGYKVGLTIERIDVNGNYTPENCTWLTFVEQQKNKRRTGAISKYYTPADVLCAAQHGIKLSTLRSRIYNYGWPIEMARILPPGAKRKTFKLEMMLDDASRKESHSVSREKCPDCQGTGQETGGRT